MPAIVTVNVTQTVAPTPNTLQSTYALISQGATNTTPGAYSLLTQTSSLSTLLNGARAASTLTQTSGTATFTATAPHGYTVGDTLFVTIAGATPSAYNGTFTVTVTTTTAFTYAISAGTATPATGTAITYTDADVVELQQMVTTWFAQGSNTAVYVLELGPGNVNDGVAFLTTWISNNPNGVAYSNNFYGFYGYIVPREWDANTNFLALVATFEAANAKTYFWVTTTLATYTFYTSLMKDVFTLIESPVTGAYPSNVLSAMTYAGAGVVNATTATAHGVVPGDWIAISGVTPAAYNGYWQALAGTTGTSLVFKINATSSPGSVTVQGTLQGSQYANSGIAANEFSIAAVAAAAAAFNPSARVPPFGYTFLFGVTPFPTQGNGALLTTISNAYVNVVGNGAEGGISDAILLNGTTADGNSFNYWYSIDWMNINLNLNISNAVINGSNNSISPLYENQDGINALQAVGASTIKTGISAGLVFGSLIQTELTAVQFAANNLAGLYNGYAVINAVPFNSYYALNPGDYKIGKYAGFAVSFSPQLGFQNIIINLNASLLVG